MRKSVLLVRWGAFGDHINITNVIKAFDEDGWDVSVEYNYKGVQIHKHNPRIKRHIFFDPSLPATKNRLLTDPYYVEKHIKAVSKNYDKVVVFQDSLENALIEPSSSSRYFWPLSKRRAKNANACYYDQSMLWAGLTDKKYMGWSGELFFTDEEKNIVKEWIDKNAKDRYLILWGLRGSMWQKATFHHAAEVIEEFTKRHPETLVVTTGDERCKSLEWDASNVIHKSGIWPFRQSLLLAKYANLVITPETGLGIGAGAHGTPKIMMLTAASLKNIVGNDKNDYSLQSPVYCSPCTRAIYDTEHCPKYGDNWVEGVHLPKCVDFPMDMLLNQMEKAYTNGREE